MAPSLCPFVSLCGSISPRQRGKLAPTLPHRYSSKCIKEGKKRPVLTFYSRSAAEIDELYERKIPAWRWSKTITAVEEQMHVVVQVKGGVKGVQKQKHTKE